jgi:hypothetical protein
MTRELIRHLRLNNVQISRVCSIVGSMHGDASHVPFSRQSVRALCGRLAQESIEEDMAKTLEIFDHMKRSDPGLVVKVELDSRDRVRTLFWSHGSSRVDYAAFGDVVTFDTTYRTNLYNLPFGLIVGVNNHFQSTMFGVVLLTEETIEAFRWCFRVFVDAMGGKRPVTVLTGTYHGHLLSSFGKTLLKNVNKIRIHFLLFCRPMSSDDGCSRKGVPRHTTSLV